MGVYLIIDARETGTGGMEPYFKTVSPNIPYVVKTITTGDYVIMDGDKIVAAIERKTWKDLADSIIDGRMDNHGKLVELKNKNNCLVYYLIEGALDLQRTTIIRKRPAKNLIAKLDHIQMRHPWVSVTHCKDKQATANRIAELMRNYISLKSEDKQKIGNYYILTTDNCIIDLL